MQFIIFHSTVKIYIIFSLHPFRMLMVHFAEFWVNFLCVVSVFIKELKVCSVLRIT